MSGILIGIGTALAIILLVVYFFFRMYQTAQGDRQRRKRAIKATARIVKIGHSRTSETDEDLMVYLTLEVTPPDGKPFEVDTMWWVQPAAAANVEVGRTVAVKIDAKNPKLIYSAERWFTDANH